MSLRTLLACLALCVLQPVASGSVIRHLVGTLLGKHAENRLLALVTGFANEELCYPALEEADEDKNGIVDQDEYFIFVQLFDTSGLLDEYETYQELPFALKVNFNFLRQVCPSDITATDCPDGDDSGISTDGAYEGDDTDEAETVYLFEVCRRTGDTINRLLASEPPSVAPTDGPSEEPSPMPTETPTFMPTDTPTPMPTETPTITPTTPAPTDAPLTPAPTEAPVTAAPVTPAPSEVPTTASPTEEPTTAAPSETPLPVEEVVPVVYKIAVEPGGTREVYIPQLIDAMDSLAPEVLSSLARRALREGRRLQAVSFPTTIDTLEVVDCPDVVPETDTCEDVTGTVTLIFQPDDAGTAGDVAEDFSEALDESIAEGDLMAALNLLSPGGDVYIIDDTITGGIPPDDNDDRGISGGGISGIVIGSLAAVLVIGLLASRREPAKDDPEELAPAPQPEEVERDIVLEEEFDPELAATIGKAAPNYGPNKDAMMDNDEAIAAMSDAASSAGESGWSSSAGVSSLNTGSHEEATANAGTLASRLATPAGAAGVAAAAATAPGPAPQIPAVTRADLDSAIESGDWAAVGATAALLAAASDSQSLSSQSNKDISGTQSNAESFDSSLDAARAAELDNLVESGDWEGVVLAAAKFEAAESQTGSGSTDSRSNAGADNRSLDSTPSKTQKRLEYRAEVEDLVRRVVPEEIENVDEMMLQFHGREEELIETLRTMEERAVAQKARQGAQKQAKVQAKRKTPEERAADASTLLTAAKTGEPAMSARSLGTGQVAESQPAVTNLGGGQLEGTAKSRSLGTGTMVEPKKAKVSNEGEKSKRDVRQSALEQAIEAGDWEAVGEAATMLSEGSVASSVETDEINRLADGISSQGSVGSSRGNLSEKAEELEELIERGDWAGVVTAAGKTSKTKPTKEEEEEARRQRRLKHRKEEEEALAQAEIWEAIAEQTKQETESTDQAATAAADWAIGRSLQALVQAEQGDTLTREDASSKAPETDDEEEV